MIHPNDTFTIYLDLDTPEAERKPQAERPALVYRYGTAGELRQQAHRFEEIGKLCGAEYIDALEECASRNLVEMRNLHKPDGAPAERLSDALSAHDLRAIAGQLPLLAELSKPDRKNSESSSHTLARE